MSKPIPDLSPALLARAEAAAQTLKFAASRMPILRSMAWDGALRERFIASGGERLPEPEYPDVDTGDAREALAGLGDTLSGEHPVLAWLTRLRATLQTTADLLDARGTPDFYTYSERLYGTPTRRLLDGKTQVLELAHHIDDTLADMNLTHLVREDADERLDAKGFAAALKPKLVQHFGDDAPRVELSETLSAKATAGSRIIRVRADASFSRMDVRQLLQHEALVHTATALNGRAQDKLPILGYAHAGTTQIQEGLAVFAEMISGTMDPVRFRRLADRVIGIQMAVDGADFIQVYHFYLERTDDPDKSFENTRRIFRGGVLTGGAPFTKDMVYLNGLLRVHNFLRTMVKLNRADLIRLLFVGKLDLEDVPALAMLYKAGELSAPKFLPPWAADLRFVVSYLAYSSFLNRIKLPGFQGYYEDMIAQVPNLWEASR